jgi:hypothetical protein
MVHNGEADQEDVRLGVGQRANASIALLSSGIPQAELDLKSSSAYRWVVKKRHLARLHDDSGLVVI